MTLEKYALIKEIQEKYVLMVLVHPQLIKDIKWLRYDDYHECCNSVEDDKLPKVYTWGIKSMNLIFETKKKNVVAVKSEIN